MQLSRRSLIQMNVKEKEEKETSTLECNQWMIAFCFQDPFFWIPAADERRLNEHLMNYKGNVKKEKCTKKMSELLMKQENITVFLSYPTKEEGAQFSSGNYETCKIRAMGYIINFVRHFHTHIIMITKAESSPWLNKETNSGEGDSDVKILL